MTWYAVQGAVVKTTSVNLREVYLFSELKVAESFSEC